MKRPTSLALAVLVAGGALALAAPAEAAAYSTGGGIGTLYNAQHGALGTPTSPEYSGHADRVQTFQRGAILWSPATGAHSVRGGIQAEYNARGGDAGPLGLPTSEETPAPGGGVLQRFQGGTVYWSPSSGAHQVGGGIGAAHASAGGVAGQLGYPTSDEIKVGGGVYQTYRGGTVYWSPTTGAHPVWGAIAAAYAGAGGVTGPLGFPTTGETTVKLGAITMITQTFQGGMIVWVASGANATYNPDPAHAHVVTGAIYQQYLADGGPALIGPPLANATTTDTTIVQPFAYEAIVNDPAVGTHTMWELIYNAWMANGGPAGKLGLPLANTSQPGTMWAHYSQFQGGRIWSNNFGNVQIQWGTDLPAVPTPTATPTPTASPAPTTAP